MTNKNEITTFSENDVVIIGIRKDGIVHIFYKKNVVVDKVAIDKMLVLYKEFLPPGKHPFLIESDEYVVFQEEGRKYAIEIEDQVPSSKQALLMDNVGYQLVAKHFISHNKPKTNYEVFKDFNAAVSWLLE